MVPGVLQIERIRQALAPQRIGRRIEHLTSTPSTNDAAWGMIDTVDEPDGLVVFAEHQSAGRGRFGRRWESPRGAGLLGSTILIDKTRSWPGGELSLLAAIAVRDAIIACTDVVPVIKWPNDLLVAGRKLSGILIESRVFRENLTAYVVGIGINCLQQRNHLATELADTATSLELESRYPIDRTVLAIALLSELDRWLGCPDPVRGTDLRREWLARAEPLGVRIHLEHAGTVFSGSVIDLDPTAALLVQLDEGGVRAFNAGDTTVVHRPSESEG